MSGAALDSRARGSDGAPAWPSPPADKPRLGISACLLGHAVRFDGGHRRDGFLCEALAPFVEWVPVCPELELGLPVPREPVRLVRAPGDAPPRLVGSRSGADYGDAMERRAAARIAALAALGLDGYVLKRGSPSCGLERVRVYHDDDAAPARVGVGRFAAALRSRLAWLPLCEEGWLADARRRDAFLAQVFSLHRLRRALAGDRSAVALERFHAAHKLLYMAHSPSRQVELGRLVARADAGGAAEPGGARVERYWQAALAALAVPASVGKHVNVLEHILGFFKGVLSAAERAELVAAIAELRAGLDDLAAPRALLLHHLRRHQPSQWLAQQVYWEPYPRAIGRNRGRG